MEGKLILFVVVASLAQCSADYGLSEEQQAKYDAVLGKECDLSSAFVEIIDLLFGIVDSKLAAISGQTEETHDDVNNMESALEKCKLASDSALDAVGLLSGIERDGYEDVQMALHAKCNEIIGSASEVLLLSDNGGSTENQEQFAAYRAAMHKPSDEWLENVYTAITNLVDASDEVTKNTIGSSKQESKDSMVITVDSWMNAINYLVAVEDKKEVTAEDLKAVRDLHNQARGAQKAISRIVVSTVLAILVQRELGLNPENSKLLLDTEIARATALGYWKDEATIIFDLLLNAPEISKLESEGASARLQNARAAATEDLIAGCIVYAELTGSYRPDATNEVEAAKAACSVEAVEVMDLFWDALVLALIPSSDKAALSTKASDLTARMRSDVSEITGKHIVPLRGGQALPAEAEDKFNDLRDGQFTPLMNYGQSILTACFGTMDALNGSGITDETLAETKAQKDIALSALKSYTGFIHAAGIVLLQVRSEQN